ncbi:MAG: peptide chain release factor N(5)-glutamine methyltransferase [Proteobacteria bacterium]|nr:peptide chain release factor N(5)-glutamine methyltransferase [Pseudomonadota bacterium]
MRTDEGNDRARIFREGVRALKEAGIPSPALDASLLLGHITGEAPGGVLLERDKSLTLKERECFVSLIERRCNRETVSRLVGEKEFFSLSFATGPDVLDPRPETELLVEEALGFLRRLSGNPRVLDLGTGSGVIAVALAVLDPRITVVATDICPKALAFAGTNALRHGVRERVRFVRADLLSAFSARARFDLLVSNPPYVTEREFPSLPPEVRLGDPRRALVAGPEGIEFYGPLARAAVEFLNPGGEILVEVGAGQHPLVQDIFSGCGIREIAAIPDLSGIKRVVRGKR